jgi:hypothetical protein
MRKLLMVFCIVLLASVALAESQKWVQPGTKTKTITASDSTTYNPPLTAVYVGTTGAVRVIGTNDKATYDCTDAPIFVGVPAGGLIRVRTWMVCSTGTDASDMVGLTFED